VAIQTWEELRALVSKKLPSLLALQETQTIGPFVAHVKPASIIIDVSDRVRWGLGFKTSKQWRSDDFLYFYVKSAGDALYNVPTMVWRIFYDKLEIFQHSEKSYPKFEMTWDMDGSLFFFRVDLNADTVITYTQTHVFYKTGDQALLNTMPKTLVGIDDIYGVRIHRIVDVKRLVADALELSKIEDFFNQLPDIPAFRVQQP
jgi:hypothetical protein